MEQMTVQIVTPDGIKYDHHAAFILVKTPEGEMGIYPGHEELIAVLEIDEIKVRRIDDENHVDWIAVNGGIIEVNKNQITVVSDSAERERDIDISRAERLNCGPSVNCKKRRRPKMLTWRNGRPLPSNGLSTVSA